MADIRTYDPRKEEAGYEALANAIIIQAANDYLRAVKKGNSSSIRALERFFRSDWFAVLTGADPEAIIEALRKKCGKPKKQDFAQKQKIR